MATFGSYRDGGTTSEIGISRMFSSNYLRENGVIDTGDLNVTERGAGANKTVDVAAGDMFFFESTTHTRLGWSDATESITITDNTSGNPRIDAIYAYWDEAVVSSSSNDNPNVIVFAALAGTAGASPVAPTDAEIQADAGAGNPFLRLADVDVSNGFSSIVDADIEDRRTWAQTIDSVDRDYNTNPERIVSGLLVAVPGSGLTASVSAGYGYVRGYYVRKDQVDDFTYTASKDTYVDIAYTGTDSQNITYTAVTLGAAEPAVASNSIRLCKVVTDATDVTSVTDLRNLYAEGWITGSSDLSLTTSFQTIVGTSVTFEVSQASRIFITGQVTYSSTFNDGDDLRADIDLDGASISEGLTNISRASGVASIPLSAAADLSAAAHTVLLKTRNSSGARGIADILVGSVPATTYHYRISPGPLNTV